MLEECRRVGVKKLVLVGTVCAYPKMTRLPFRETDLWSGYPDETNAPYGIAKRTLLTGACAYREQYGLNAIYLVPANLYGPRDNFDPETSHVIPAIVRKTVDAVEKGATRVVLWGDGSPTREFLYVEDCADALVRAASQYDRPEPVNLGTGEEISIRDLAALIGEQPVSRASSSGIPSSLEDSLDVASMSIAPQSGSTSGLGHRSATDWKERSPGSSPIGPRRLPPAEAEPRMTIGQGGV